MESGNCVLPAASVTSRIIIQRSMDSMELHVMICLKNLEKRN